MLLGDVWRGEEGGRPETTCCAQKAPDVVHTTCLYEGEIKKIVSNLQSQLSKIEKLLLWHAFLLTQMQANSGKFLYI